MRLFVDRAGAQVPDLAANAGDERIVGEICRHLDGMPLAIELAAARLTVLSPPEILDGLRQRFQLLRGRDPSAPARQRTMQGLLDWDYELLSDAEQAAFGATFSLQRQLRLAGGIRRSRAQRFRGRRRPRPRLVALRLLIGQRRTHCGQHSVSTPRDGQGLRRREVGRQRRRRCDATCTRWALSRPVPPVDTWAAGVDQRRRARDRHDGRPRVGPRVRSAGRGLRARVDRERPSVRDRPARAGPPGGRLAGFRRHRAAPQPGAAALAHRRSPRQCGRARRGRRTDPTGDHHSRHRGHAGSMGHGERNGRHHHGRALPSRPGVTARCDSSGRRGAAADLGPDRKGRRAVVALDAAQTRSERATRSRSRQRRSSCHGRPATMSRWSGLSARQRSTRSASTTTSPRRRTSARRSASLQSSASTSTRRSRSSSRRDSLTIGSKTTPRCCSTPRPT